MKLLLASFAFLFACLFARADQYSSIISAENYPLTAVMVANKTYAGVCVNVQVVKVRSGQGGLVGLPVGLINFTFGSSIGVRSYKAVQYVIRLDQQRGENSQARLITVVQGIDSPMIQAGRPVFIETSGNPDLGEFFARIIEAKTPEAYPVQGMEEARQAALDR